MMKKKNRHHQRQQRPSTTTSLSALNSLVVITVTATGVLTALSTASAFSTLSSPRSSPLWSTNCIIQSTVQVAASMPSALLLSKCGEVPRRLQTRPSSSSSMTTLWASTSDGTAVSTNENLVPGIMAIDHANDDIRSYMKDIRETPYFRLFCVDILASCEYMPQELFECYSELCEVYPVEDDVIPREIRDSDLMECELEIDGWARWDMPSNDYYDTDEFPEGYTGYDGSEVWHYIHKKICFDGYGYDGDNWKADFNKAVSGIHSVVSAQVARGIQDKIDAGEEFTPDEVWRDPKVEFDRRLGTHGETPHAMENLYFSYMLLLSATAKVKDKLMADCANGKIDNQSAHVLQEFLSHPILSSPDVSKPSMRLRNHALQSKSDLWEARMRSRELLRIINCVQCNKCRLHGKVAMMGLSTALQIHMGKNGDGDDPQRIRRVELAALISTLYKFSQAVDFCRNMRNS